MNKQLTVANKYTMRRELMQQAPRYVVFVTVVESGSITAAAEHLGIGKSMVSRHLTRLETDLGTRLLHRSTRRLAVTRAGEVFLAEAKRTIQHAEQALSAVQQSQQAPITGALRLSVAELAAKRLAPLLAQFIQRYPQVTLEIVVDDSRVDLAEQRFDIGVRYGWPKSGDMVLLPLTQETQCLIVSSSYPHPLHKVQRVGDLAQLHWITPNPEIVDFAKWPVTLGNGESGTLPITSRSVTNSANYILELVLAGVGATVYPLRNVIALIQEGALQQLLPELGLPQPGMYLNYPSKRTLPPAAKRFIEMAHAHFAQAK